MLEIKRTNFGKRNRVGSSKKIGILYHLKRNIIE
jgi:hypothetical protein